MKNKNTAGNFSVSPPRRRRHHPPPLQPHCAGGPGGGVRLRGEGEPKERLSQVVQGRGRSARKRRSGEDCFYTSRDSKGISHKNYLKRLVWRNLRACMRGVAMAHTVKKIYFAFCCAIIPKKIFNAWLIFL